MEILRITFSTDEIHCSLCKKRYTDPRILPCLHSFCHKCLLGVALKKGQGLTIQCPKCKKEHHVTDTGCAELPTNVHILGLIQLHKVKSEKDRKCFVCQLSKNTSDATHLCLSCNDLLCCTCSKGHNSASVTATHKVVTLDDICKGKYDHEIYNKVTIFCEKHEHAEYMLHCDDCQTMMCIKCALEDHCKHKHTLLANIILSKQILLHECRKQVSSSKDQVLKSIEERIANVDRNQKEFEHNLHMGVASVKDQLHREKKEILEKVHKLFEDEKSQLSKLKTRLKTSSAFEDMYSLVVSKGGPGLALMGTTLEEGVETLTQAMKVELPRFKDMSPAIIGLDEQEDLITFTEKVQESRNLKATDPTSGEHSANMLQKESAKTDADWMKKYISRKKTATSEVSGKQVHCKFTTPSTVYQNVAASLHYQTSFIAKVSKDSLQPSVNSLSLYAGKLLLVDTNNIKVKIYTVEGCLYNLLSRKSSILPEKAVLSKCLVGIGDGKLVIYAQPKSELRTINIVQLPINTSDFRPVISRYKDNQIIVANLSNDEIKVFDITGDLRQTRKTHVMGPIVSVQWSKIGKLVMCSWNEKGSVQIESDNGEFLLEVHKLVDGKRLQDWRPVDACMSSLGFIVVADSKRNELSVFGPQGRELMVLDTRENDFTHPGCIQMDEDDSLFVSGKDGLIAHYRLSCYSFTYEKLT